MQVVWFKRDLRIHDHPALYAAAQQGPLIPLYILEPDLWKQPDMSYRHFAFLSECVQSLDNDLKKLGQRLIVRVGSARDVLQDLHREHGLTALWSHQETWNDWTYQRDKEVAAWLSAHRIPWYEPPQNGVIRRLKQRESWSARWYEYMKKPCLPAPDKLFTMPMHSDSWPLPNEIGLQDDACVLRQKGGRAEALRQLHSFLFSRGEYYTRAMSSPVTAFESCSRLSPHFAFGTISIREAFQAAEARYRSMTQLSKEVSGAWLSAMRSFLGRLRWHCHFMQKLEDEPAIEYRNMHPSYDGLRDEIPNPLWLQAWQTGQTGQTGYPMMDACMRALTATGWLNFRMRAMLMSFASQHLWLDWRQPALHLARLFTDYEPGIHYPQVQMQSATTGINSIRIYNPIKQGMEQDPEGAFIRRWVPELADIPDTYLHTPWLSPVPVKGYPQPIVEEKTARKSAADKLYALRKETSHQLRAARVVKKHASRKTMGRRKTSATVERIKLTDNPSQPVQAELPL